MALPDYLAEEIHTLVWSGFYDRDEVLEIVCEQDDEVDESEAAGLIDAEVAAKHAAEREWEDETDCDRLDRVFAWLNENGIIALQNAGMTQSDGLEDVTEIYDGLGRDGSGVVGYCFYHGQDLARAVAGTGLYLTFGDIEGTDEKGVEIGRMIRSALANEHFEVTWNGRIDTRILVPRIEWKKRWTDV